MTPAARAMAKWAHGEADAKAGAQQAQLLRHLWSTGQLSGKLYDDQLPFYAFLAERIYGGGGEGGKLVGNVHRQFGKSFALALVATEFAQRRPGTQIRFVAPTQKDLRKIVRPALRVLLRDCPDDLRPSWNSVDSVYTWPNGSELHIAGANGDHEDDSRGQKSDLNVVDEAGFVDRLDYLLHSVLLPQTLTTGGRTVLISTPPASPSHEFIPILREAESEGSYFVWPIGRTTHLTARAKAALIHDMGGATSTQVQRELECKLIVDQTRAVCPEFTEERAATLVTPVKAPTYEQPLVSMDVGFEDYTHVLFGFYDFKRATLCVQDECRLRRMRTDQLAAEIAATEKRLWTNHKPPARVSDVNLILLADLGALHHLNFMPTSKDEKESMVNEMRLWVQNGRVQIDPKCIYLIRQLRGAVWDKPRKQFERTAQDGHFDAVDALIYMLRNAPVNFNPYPALDPSITPVTHQMGLTVQKTDLERNIMDIFRRKARRQ